MNIISKQITLKISQLREYTKNGFAGVFGASDATGAYTVTINAECLKRDITPDTEVQGVLTTIQWDENIPLSAGMKFNIKSFTDPDSITLEEALSALKEVIEKNKTQA